MKKVVFVMVLVTMLFTSCVSSTQVRIESDVPGATVFIDGQEVGTTPMSMKLSNAVWEDPDILIKKEGYKDLNTSVKKEFKVANALFGVLWGVPWLYCYGPKASQNYMMIEDGSKQ